MSFLSPDPAPGPIAPLSPRPWLLIRGVLGMTVSICGLLVLLLAGLHVRSAVPAREAAVGLLRGRPEVAAALGVPFERSLAVNVLDLMPFFGPENEYRFVMLLKGPEGFGLADVRLFALSPGRDEVLFRTPFGDWSQLPRTLEPQRPVPQSAALLQQAAARLQEGRPEQAWSILTEAARLQPLLPAVWYLRAVAARELQRPEQALLNARFALALHHADPQLVLLIEQLLPETARPSERVEAWATYLSYAPHDPVALARHAHARAHAGEAVEAAAFLERRCQEGSEAACRSLHELVEQELVRLPPRSDAAP